MIRVNLLGLPRPKRRRARVPMVLVAPGGGLVLGALVVVIAAVAGVQWWRYSSMQAEGVRLDTQIRTLQSEKAELAQVQAQYETFSKAKDLLTARINIIEQLKAQQSGPVQLLDALANAVSATDSLWLTNFEKTGDSISISGVSMTVKAVADLITRLTASGIFKEVDLKEAKENTTHDYQSFDFTFVGQLAPAPAPAGSTTQPKAG